ncbi:MAG: ribulose-phosphate 3-epimerase [Chitinophagales bacterium]
MATIVSPSLLSADFSNLAGSINMLNQSKAEWIHIDVMDGNFVPNISFGFPIIKAIRPLTKKFFDVHLMIDSPGRYFQAFKDAGADHLTIHYEGNLHLDSLIRDIQKLGMSAGVAVNPATPIEVIKPVLPMLDLVLIMSVNPGFGGQKFIAYAAEKVQECRKLIVENRSGAKIEVDGGVDLSNCEALKIAGANILVAGSAVFGNPDPLEAIEKLSR